MALSKLGQAVGWQPTEVTGVQDEGLALSKRTAVGWQPTEVTWIEEGRDWHFQSRTAVDYRG